MINIILQESFFNRNNLHHNKTVLIINASFYGIILKSASPYKMGGLLMTLDRKKFARWGEDIATEYLLRKGYSILIRNFRANRGEIDIIARNREWVVFVEVKTGQSRKYGLPEERITPAKQRQLYKTASYFIQQHPDLEVNYRFDAIIIDGTSRQYDLRHYPNAFYLNL